jgi:hypothetical protein
MGYLDSLKTIKKSVDTLGEKSAIFIDVETRWGVAKW